MILEYGKIKGLKGLVFVLKDKTKIQAVYPFLCEKISKDFALEVLKEQGISLRPKKADLSWLADVLKGAKYGFNNVELEACSEFRTKIYKKLFQTKPGTVINYSDLSFEKARAVGSAMKNNPIPLLIPCHRVSAKNGAENYNISCYKKRPTICKGVDVSSCSKRIKTALREYEACE